MAGATPVAEEPLTILVVDDDSLIRWSALKALRRAGHTVEQTSDGGETRQLLRKDGARFDVVLLDLRLPDTNDLSLVSDIRALSPRSAVVIMTDGVDSSLLPGGLVMPPPTFTDLMDVIRVGEDAPAASGREALA